MARKSRKNRTRAVQAATFVTFGLVAAFLVSAIAGVLDDETAAVEREPAARTLAPGETVRVEVLNGAGTTGLARDATGRLRGDGFDVVFFGNAGRFDHARSVVLDRSGDPARARAVARALGIDSVAAAPDPSLLLDVSVVLGADWPPRPAGRTSPLRRLADLFRQDPPTP